MDDLINQLGLNYLDQESGFYTKESISAIEVSAKDGKSPASNSIYYALTKEHPQNHLHWLLPDDYHILISGGPADYYIFHPDGTAEMHTLGLDVANEERPMVVTPGGSRKAVRLRLDSAFVLVGSVVTPAWNPDRVIVGAGPPFIDQFTDKAPWATPEFLKSLIGPNWNPEA